HVNFRDDDEELADSNKELYVVDETVADNVIDEILTKINIEDSTTLVFTAPSTKVPSVSDSKPTHVFPIEDIQALITRALWKKKNIPCEKPANVQSLATMQRMMYFLIAHVHNLGKSFPDKFADKMDSVVPRMVADALKKRFPKLLTDTMMSDDVKDFVTASERSCLKVDLEPSTWRQRHGFKAMSSRLLYNEDPNDVVFFGLAYTTLEVSFVTEASGKFMAQAKRKLSRKTKSIGGSKPVDHEVEAEIVRDVIHKLRPRGVTGHEARVKKSQVTKFGIEYRRMKGEAISSEKRSLLDKVDFQSKKIEAQSKQIELLSKKNEAQSKKLESQSKQIGSLSKNNEIQSKQIECLNVVLHKRWILATALNLMGCCFSNSVGLERATPEYMENLSDFIKVAENDRVRSGNDEIFYPCKKCRNGVLYVNAKEVKSHLIRDGFTRGYTCWDFHGEKRVVNSTSECNMDDDLLINNDRHDLNNMLDDLDDDVAQKEHAKFEKLFLATKKALFGGCTKLTILSAVIKLFKIKASFGWSDISFTTLLEFLHKEMLPDDNALPISTYQGKKLM
ncbi:hypothetical protein Tco_0051601, partial [Tanacetum coccineum]